MRDRDRSPDAGEYGHDSARAMPRWLKIAGIVLLLLALLVAVLMFIGGGEHGPSRHFGAPPGMTAIVGGTPWNL